MAVPDFPKMISRRVTSLRFMLFVMLIFHSYTPSSSLQLSADSELTYEEEYQLFEAEEFDNSHLKRQKRFIYLNVDTNMAVALLVSIPLTFILPSMTNLFNKWRRKRSVEVTDPYKFDGHAIDQSDVDKVFTYFQLLEIPEPSCQLKAICEFSADPEKYNPLSEVILRRVRNPGLPALLYSERKAEHLHNSSLHHDSTPDTLPQSTSLYELYNRAADEGLALGPEKCEQQYSSACHYPTDKLLNMPVIRFWNALQSVLKLNFKDTPNK